MTENAQNGSDNTSLTPPTRVTNEAADSLNQARSDLAEIRTLLEQARAANVAAALSERTSEESSVETATALAAAKSAINEAQTLIAQLAASKGSVQNDLAAVVSTKEQATATVKEIDAIHLRLTALAGELDGLKIKTQSSSDSAVDLLAKIQEFAKTSVEETAAMTAARIASKESESLLAGMAKKAESVEQRVAAYEAKLQDLQKQADEQLQAILGLLPGATSAGLAFAFDARAKQFTDPSRRWQSVFFGSLTILVILALTGLWQVYQSAVPLTYDELFRLWLARLPIAGALIWLALHASRESALAKRLEEDYGYKAAVAASFQGFNKQMSDLTEKASVDSPLAKLCSDTLATIGSPPGRIYDKHQLTVSPTGELTGVLKEFSQKISGLSQISESETKKVR